MLRSCCHDTKFDAFGEIDLEPAIGIDVQVDQLDASELAS